MQLDQIQVKNQYGRFKLDEILDEFKELLYSKLENEVIVEMKLFGSYVRGEADENSDLDICIVFDENKLSELRINCCVDKISDELLDKYGIVIHALCFRESYYQKNKQYSLLFKDIEREGIAC